MKHVVFCLIGLVVFTVWAGSTSPIRQMARSDSTLTLREEPSVPSAADIARDLIASGRSDEGERFLRKHVKEHPDDDLARVCLIAWLRKTHRLKEAIRQAGTLIRRNRYMDAVYHIRGSLYFEDGQSGKAFMDLATAVDLNDDNTESRLLMGRIYRNGGLSGMAMMILTNAIVRSPDDPAEFYMERARAFAAMGDTATACQDYQDAIRLGFEPSEEDIEVCPNCDE
ncbi:MAG: tetratricopeptide repeat protein [Candidatus Kapaibacterium sp.]